MVVNCVNTSDPPAQVTLRSATALLAALVRGSVAEHHTGKFKSAHGW